MTGVTVREASWSEDREALSAVRFEVFVIEQKVPIEIELDGLDAECAHAIAEDERGAVLGVARLRADGHVGRIAVRQAFRGRGIGARLVDHLVARARRAGLESVDLDSQEHAIGFYEKLGFEARGETFMEAGIPHRNMVRRLSER